KPRRCRMRISSYQMALLRRVHNNAPMAAIATTAEGSGAAANCDWICASLNFVVKSATSSSAPMNPLLDVGNFSLPTTTAPVALSMVTVYDVLNAPFLYQRRVPVE